MGRLLVVQFSHPLIGKILVKNGKQRVCIEQQKGRDNDNDDTYNYLNHDQDALCIKVVVILLDLVLQIS